MKKAEVLHAAGLKRITVSLDSLDDAIFKQMNDVDFPVADVLADPALAACLPLIDTGLPEPARAMGSPLRIDGRFFGAGHPPPAKAEHTRDVLAEAGYDAAEIDALLAEGCAFEEPPPR